MATLAYERSGSGEPLVLLHALGLSKQTWAPVVPALAEQHDVIAVDLPGFGDSPPFPDDVEPSPAMLAARIGVLLDELGVESPHVVGNSVGGWIALELALQRPVRSVTLVGPAGLWRDTTPWYDRVSLRLSRVLARYLRFVLVPLMRFGLARLIVLGQAHGRPMHMTREQARATVVALGTCVGFRRTLTATLDRRFLGGQHIIAPVTLAWGERDRVILERQSRNTDQLPPGVRIVSMPRCGHVPMTDDPQLVADVILTATRSTANAPHLV